MKRLPPPPPPPRKRGRGTERTRVVVRPAGVPAHHLHNARGVLLEGLLPAPEAAHGGEERPVSLRNGIIVGARNRGQGGDDRRGQETRGCGASAGEGKAVHRGGVSVSFCLCGPLWCVVRFGGRCGCRCQLWGPRLPLSCSGARGAGLVLPYDTVRVYSSKLGPGPDSEIQNRSCLFWGFENTNTSNIFFNFYFVVVFTYAVRTNEC